MKENEVAISEIEKAEKLIRARDEAKLADYITRLKALNKECGFELYIPEQPLPKIQIRRII